MSGTQDYFEIGDEDLLAQIELQSVSVDTGERALGAESRLKSVLDDIRARIGTLLKTETVSFLLGAGASVACGGELIGAVPLKIENALQEKGSSSRRRVRRWLEIFYLAAKYSSRGGAVPVSREEILERRDMLREGGTQSIQANFEQVLATLHRWRSALPGTGGRLRVDSALTLDAKSNDIEECLRQATGALAKACELPTIERNDGLLAYKTLIRKLLTRPLNLKRVNIFTLNYDTLVEQAADAEGVVLLDGFVGTQRRVFRPESYEQDLYFPAETTEGRVHRFDRVLHLYKLHGSVTWTANEPTIDNPYGVQSAAFSPDGGQLVLIYPTPAKYGETLNLPYSELFRRFASTIVRPQSVLFVIGYGFGDEHVNTILRQALAIPSFTLVIVDPAPQSRFVKTLREQRDRRVWIAEGPKLGTLAGFVDQALPDLREEEVLKKVLSTHRALASGSAVGGDLRDGE